MTPTQALASALQKLPPRLRATLYTVLGLAGAALAVCSMAGVEDLGPVSLAQALEIYALLSAATGGVAVANVRQLPGDQQAGPSFDEDVDLSSFEPVGHVSDVYGEVPV
jgi:hypothetical protein